MNQLEILRESLGQCDEIILDALLMRNRIVEDIMAYKEANDIPEEAFDMMIGNIIDDKEVQNQVGYEKYDIVTANILADVLVPLTPVIVAQMKKGAYYITSGILDVKEDVVVKAVKDAGLTLVEVTHQGEWVSVTARKD